MADQFCICDTASYSWRPKKDGIGRGITSGGMSIRNMDHRRTSTWDEYKVVATEI